MARPKMESSMTDYSTKGEGEEVPVSPCQGWTDPCEFCDKRFCNWEEVNEDVLAKIPTKPGIIMIALKNKNITEVVNFVIDSSDIQKTAFPIVDLTRDRVSDKKSKVTKSVILIRWMTFKNTSDKDVVSLCAHWNNNGVLPKFMERWPGLDILEKTDSLMFSDRLQKWCFPKKDAFWRKPKPPPTKIAELVDGCVWDQPCEICDTNFGEWKKVDDVVYNDLAPDAAGIYMLAVRYGKITETINICFDPKDIKLDIQSSLKNTHKSLNYVLKNKKYVNKNATFLVRWLELKDVESDNCCFLYAHWLNSERMPEMNFKLPGKRQVEKNKYFVLRNHDKKWCYEIEIYKQLKTGKSKSKKHLMQDLEDDFNDLEI